MSDYDNIEPADAAKLIQAGECCVIDVRTEKEFRSHRIAGAYLLPVQQLAARHCEIPRNSSKKLLLVCEHGIRSVNACAALAKGGWKNLANLSGGMAEWIGCKLPYVTGTEKDAVDLGPKK